MKTEETVQVRSLQEEDVGPITEAFSAMGWNKPASQYRRYIKEQEQGRRLVLVAFTNSAFARYLTIVWEPDYPYFKTKGIPEIQDLNVLPHARRKGIATILMNEAESVVAKHSTEIGIGVGLSADYGAAQRLYILRGYVPDGNGIVWKNKYLNYGDAVTVDDDLVLMFVKKLAD